MTLAHLAVFVIAASGAAAPDSAPPDAPPPDAASETPPHDAAEAAAWYFERERWAEAADAFARAYETEPDPRFLYARAQALRADGRCDEAGAGYRRYLEVATDPEGRKFAQANLERCEPVGDEPQPPTPRPTPAPAPASIDPVQPQGTSPRADTSAREKTDRVALGLIGGGGAGALAGTALAVLGGLVRARADRTSDTEDVFDRTLRVGAIELGTGVALACVGVTLATIGAVRLARTRRSRPHASLGRWTGGVLRF